jgi:RNA polymerase sigma-70 factor (ECF subfamily)
MNGGLRVDVVPEPYGVARPDDGTGTAVVRDDELVRAAQAGDAASVGQLYERYFDKVYGYLVFKLGAAADAEDLAGQVFLKALESLGGYKWTGVPFQAWLFRIAHNLLVDHLRRKTKRVNEPLDETLPDRRHTVDPEVMLQEKVTRQGLLAAVERLTELQKQVISLKFAGGLSNAQVARLMGKTEGAVKALQHAALQSLHRQFAKGMVP